MTYEKVLCVGGEAAGLWIEVDKDQDRIALAYPVIGRAGHRETVYRRIRFHLGDGAPQYESVPMFVPVKVQYSQEGFFVMHHLQLGYHAAMEHGREKP